MVYEVVIRNLNRATGTLFEQPGLQVLNLCMAPGGFTKEMLTSNETAYISGISLLPKDGGHCMEEKSLEGLNHRFQIQWLDITMLAEEFGVHDIDIPEDHPEKSEFCFDRPYRGERFDLVLADGVVLKNHERSAYRTRNVEAIRLDCSELVIAMQRVKPGGCIIILLHQIDAWRTAELLRDFEQFAFVDVCKPAQVYEDRSSFYLIAKDIQPVSTEALSAISKWKETWKSLTFGFMRASGATVEQPSIPATPQMETNVSDSLERLDLNEREPDSATQEGVKSLLDNFGGRLLELGHVIWQTQTRGLQRVGAKAQGKAKIVTRSGRTHPPWLNKENVAERCAKSQTISGRGWRQEESDEEDSDRTAKLRAIAGKSWRNV